MGGGYFSKVSRFRSGQESQILNKTVSPPLAPRHRQQQNVRLGSVHTCTSTQYPFINAVFYTDWRTYYYIFLPYTLNFQSTVPNVATVFQSYNGRKWLPERGIVHLNASPECIISFPGTDQNSSLLHRQNILSFHSVRHCRAWVRVGRFVWDEEVQGCTSSASPEFMQGSVKASLTFKCMTEHLFADFSYSIALDTYLWKQMMQMNRKLIHIWYNVDKKHLLFTKRKCHKFSWLFTASRCSPRRRLICACRIVCKVLVSIGL